jgi:hypothetical protein
MNIDELTLGQIKQLKSLFNQGDPAESTDPFIGQYCIVRTHSAGVFAGTVKQRIGRKILLENSRMLWKWNTANNGISLSEVAVYGINQANSKICCVVPLKLVEDIEISICSDISRRSIEGAGEYVS